MKISVYNNLSKNILQNLATSVLYKRKSTQGTHLKIEELQLVKDKQSF